jgi:hypothetical protein
LARVPDGHDLLRIRDRLALGLRALGRGGSTRGGALPERNGVFEYKIRGADEPTSEPSRKLS